MNSSKTKQSLKGIKTFFDRLLVVFDSFVAKLKLRNLKEGEYGVKKTIKLVDQLGDPDPDLVTGYYQKIVDKNAAKRFGTDDLTEYTFWAWRSCGVACVMAVLKIFNLYDGTLFNLVKRLDAEGGYLHKDKWGRKDIGWKHSALKKTLQENGLDAEINSHLSLNGLIREIVSNRLVIVSIKARGKMESSHMILVSRLTWTKEKEPELLIYDPYSLDGQGGKKKMKLDEFSKIFLNRGISIWK